MNKSSSNVSLLTYIVEIIKTLKWIRVFQIDKRDRESGILLGDFLLGCGKLGSDFDESNLFQS